MVRPWGGRGLVASCSFVALLDVCTNMVLELFFCTPFRRLDIPMNKIRVRSFDVKCGRCVGGYCLRAIMKQLTTAATVT